MTVFMDPEKEGGARMPAVNGRSSTGTQKDNSVRIEQRRLERHPDPILRLLTVISDRNLPEIVRRIPLGATQMTEEQRDKKDSRPAFAHTLENASGC
jgi:hypothetical protein